MQQQSPHSSYSIHLLCQGIAIPENFNPEFLQVIRSLLLENSIHWALPPDSLKHFLQASLGIAGIFAPGNVAQVLIHQPHGNFGCVRQAPVEEDCSEE